jgi:hypothetical protein
MSVATLQPITTMWLVKTLCSIAREILIHPVADYRCVRELDTTTAAEGLSTCIAYTV